MSLLAFLRIDLRIIGETKDKLQSEEAGILGEFAGGMLNTDAIHRLAETRGYIAKLCGEEAQIRRKIAALE